MKFIHEGPHLFQRGDDSKIKLPTFKNPLPQQHWANYTIFFTKQPSVMGSRLGPCPFPKKGGVVYIIMIINQPALYS